MKQSFKLIVAGLGVLALTACGQGNDDNTSGDTEGYSKDNPVDVKMGSPERIHASGTLFLGLLKKKALTLILLALMITSTKPSSCRWRSLMPMLFKQYRTLIISEKNRIWI